MGYSQIWLHGKKLTTLTFMQSSPVDYGDPEGDCEETAVHGPG